jgi:hypothetical protein
LALLLNLQHTISSGFLRSQPSTARAVCHSSENNSLSFAAAEGSASKPFSSQAASDVCQATYHRRAAATSRARRRFSASKPRLRVYLKVSVVDPRLQETAFEADTGRSALADRN